MSPTNVTSITDVSSQHANEPVYPEHAQPGIQSSNTHQSPPVDIHQTQPWGWELYGGDVSPASPEAHDMNFKQHLEPSPPPLPSHRLSRPPPDTMADMVKGTKTNDRVYVPKREGSVSPDLERTGTIDGVISAWQESTQAPPSRRSSVSALDDMNDRRTIASKRPQPAKTPVDIAATEEVDPLVRASLDRYLTMLRKESSSVTDKEKYEVFKSFLQKELRLRAVLYDIDDPDLKPRRSSPPPLRLASNSPEDPPKSTTFENKQDGVLPMHKEANPRNNLGVQTQSATKPPGSKSPQNSSDESYVIIDDTVTEEYSPGGRPRISRPQRPSVQTEIKSPGFQSTKMPGSPSDYAPIVVEASDHKQESQPKSASGDAPEVVDSSISKAGPVQAQAPSAIDVPLVKEPPRPVYTPFRYNEAPSNAAYAELRQASAESGRAMSQAQAAARSPSVSQVDETLSPSLALRQNEEAFLGLIREKSVRQASSRKNKAVGSGLKPHDGPAKKLCGYVSSLSSLQPQNENSALKNIEEDVNEESDDFGFIRQIVLSWDKVSREIREGFNKEQHHRQEDSESHIDELFNAKEIGYADIKRLESDFQKDQIEKEQQEQKREFDSFSEQVYEPVTARLNRGIKALEPQFVRAIELLELEAVSGSQAISSLTEKPRASLALATALTVFEKLQIRYRKRAEAERERDRRKAVSEECSAKAAGDRDTASRAVADFELAEKRSVVQAAKDSDDRCNKLMDVFDSVVIRTLGENEAFIDGLKSQIQQTDTEIRDVGKYQGDLYGPEGLRQTLRSAESVINFISTDSVSTLQSSDAADRILNEADYYLSYANARLEDAPDGTFEQLAQDRGKEDEKIKVDTEGRLSSVQKGPEETLHLIRSLVARIGDDPEHQERIRKALEAAKKRNAAKDGSNT